MQTDSRVMLARGTRLALLFTLFCSTLCNFSIADVGEQNLDDELRAFLQENIAEQSAIQDQYDAQVWTFNMQQRMAPYGITEKEQIAILSAVHREASGTGIAPDIVLAVIAIESSFNRFAVSTTGAQGLMQVMPFWKNEIGRNDDNLMDIDTNVHYGCKILQFYLEREKGHLARALARYNGSLGRTTYSEKVLLAWENSWRSGRM